MDKKIEALLAFGKPLSIEEKADVILESSHESSIKYGLLKDLGLNDDNICTLAIGHDDNSLIEHMKQKERSVWVAEKLRLAGYVINS